MEIVDFSIRYLMIASFDWTNSPSVIYLAYVLRDYFHSVRVQLIEKVDQIDFWTKTQTTYLILCCIHLVIR